MILEKLVLGSYFVNCYILGNEHSKEAVIIDPGAEFKKIDSVIKKKQLLPTAIINTHGHLDHIQEDDSFKVPVYIHSQDRDCFTDPKKNLSAFFGAPFIVNSKAQLLEDGQVITLAGFKFEVIHTPGHTRGGICLKVDGLLFSGDTLFAGSVGRTDFPGADAKILIESIKSKLLVIKDDLKVFPGHGQDTSLELERQTNCFLN
ncbi:MAG: MBL fold metallo-hydrolase [Candidatus Gygaella obscura]|nr:MBL fold metallo-hydrolase [Candidatus Gygaella obscura]